MPQVKVSKASLSGPEPIASGVYEIRLDGFEPAFSKDKNSVNLNPIMKIINHPDLADRRIYENLNSQAGWVQFEFSHGFGQPMQETGPDDTQLPGIWKCKNHGEGECNCDPKGNWEYLGPLTGHIARVEIVQTPNQKGGTRPAIKRYFCSVPGCTEKHSESLVK